MYRAIIAAVARSKYVSGLAALERGDLDVLLQEFADELDFSFAGDSPLGARLHTRQGLWLWFERLHRLLPHPRFEIHDVLVQGWPWDLRMAIRASINSTVLGEPYRNDFHQFLRLRWMKVVEDYVLEDTQRWERACHRLAAAGIVEASAGPITDQTPG